MTVLILTISHALFAFLVSIFVRNKYYFDGIDKGMHLMHKGFLFHAENQDATPEELKKYMRDLYDRTI